MVVVNYKSIIITIVILLIVSYTLYCSIIPYTSELWKNRNHEEKIEQLKNKLKKCFDYEHMQKHIDKLIINPGHKSYIINKRNVSLCLEDDENNYYNDDLLLHVLIHELSHSICNETGHTEQFYAIDDDLQRIAKEKNFISKTFDPMNHLDYCKFRND